MSKTTADVAFPRLPRSVGESNKLSSHSQALVRCARQVPRSSSRPKTPPRSRALAMRLSILLLCRYRIVKEPNATALRDYYHTFTHGVDNPSARNFFALETAPLGGW